MVGKSPVKRFGEDSEVWTLRWELQRQFQGYEVTQHNIIKDVLGGYSKDVGKTVETLVGGRGEEILRRMQKSVLCNSLNIARPFKVLVD